MPIFFDLIQDGAPKAKMLAMRRGAKRGLDAALTYYHMRIRPRAFQLVGHSDGMITRRPGWYEWKKGKVKGHRRPNVWSGRTEMRSRLARISVTASPSRGARGTARYPTIPDYFWRRGRKYTRQGSIPDELFRLSAHHIQTMFSIAMFRVRQELARADRKRTRTRIR